MGKIPICLNALEKVIIFKLRKLSFKVFSPGFVSATILKSGSPFFPKPSKHVSIV